MTHTHRDKLLARPYQIRRSRALGLGWENRRPFRIPPSIMLTKPMGGEWTSFQVPPQPTRWGNPSVETPGNSIYSNLCLASQSRNGTCCWMANRIPSKTGPWQTCAGPKRNKKNDIATKLLTIFKIVQEWVTPGGGCFSHQTRTLAKSQMTPVWRYSSLANICIFKTSPAKSRRKCPCANSAPTDWWGPNLQETTQRGPKNSSGQANIWYWTQITHIYIVYLVYVETRTHAPKHLLTQSLYILIIIPHDTEVIPNPGYTWPQKQNDLRCLFPLVCTTFLRLMPLDTGRKQVGAQSESMAGIQLPQFCQTKPNKVWHSPLLQVVSGTRSPGGSNSLWPFQSVVYVQVSTCKSIPFNTLLSGFAGLQSASMWNLHSENNDSRT